jgi:carboxypeptidase C (cathepsin A)
MRNVLGFKSDLFYQGPFGGGYPPPTAFRGDWMSVRWNRGGPTAGAANAPPSTSQALRAAMNTNPRLRVLVASGYYDLVSSYYDIEYAVRHLPPDLARRVTVHSYPGGHAAYTDDTVRHNSRGRAAFVQAAAR